MSGDIETATLKNLARVSDNARHANAAQLAIFFVLTHRNRFGITLPPARQAPEADPALV